MFLRKIPTRIFMLGFLVVIVLGIVIFSFMNREYNLEFTKHLVLQQRTVSRAQSSNLSSFMQLIGESVVILSKLPSVERRDETTIQAMDVFVEQRAKNDLIGGVLLTDEQGVVRYNSNILKTRDVGASIADRDYFIWAKNQSENGNYFISDPIVSNVGASKGHTVFVIASPTYKNGVFSGVIAASVKLGSLTKYFLDLMKVSDQTEVYLVDENGEVLYDKFSPDTFGDSIYEIIKGRLPSENILFNDKLSKALSEQKGDGIKTTLLEARTGKKMDVLVAFSPVKLISKNWTVIMITPGQDIMGQTTPVFTRYKVMLVLVLITFLFYSVEITWHLEKKSKEELTN